MAESHVLSQQVLSEVEEGLLTVSPVKTEVVTMRRNLQG